jgi:hypothetical protein
MRLAPKRLPFATSLLAVLLAVPAAGCDDDDGSTASPWLGRPGDTTDTRQLGADTSSPPDTWSGSDTARPDTYAPTPGDDCVTASDCEFTYCRCSDGDTVNARHCDNGTCVGPESVCPEACAAFGASWNAPSLPPAEGCSAAQHDCGDGRCLPASWICDGELDCGNGSDERGCAPSCDASRYQCQAGQCLPGSWRCDGEDDCPDGDDEWGC